MASQYIYLTGITKWCQRLRKPDEKFQNYQLNIWFDEDSWKAYNSLGLGLKLRKDDDGEYVTLKRPETKLIKREMVEFGPPKVFDKDNNPWDDRIIGNGSKVTAKIVVYDTIKGPGHRLESVRVDDWVEYNPPAVEGAANLPAATVRPALPF